MAKARDIKRAGGVTRDAETRATEAKARGALAIQARARLAEENREARAQLDRAITDTIEHAAELRRAAAADDRAAAVLPAALRRNAAELACGACGRALAELPERDQRSGTWIGSCRCDLPADATPNRVAVKLA